MSLTVKKINYRISVIYIVTFFIFLLIISRLSFLQVYRHDDLLHKAEIQQKRKPKLAKKRGTITDRNGNKLAVDIQTVSLYAHPVEFNLKKYPIEMMAKKISEVIGEDEKVLKKKLSGKSYLWLKRQMPSEMAEKLKKIRFPGIIIEYENKRIYPKNDFAAPLLGFTGIDNQGLSGIELSFEDVLTDKSSEEKIYRDAIGYEVLRKQENEPFTASLVKANKVVLTLDENIQYFAEKSIAEGVKKYKAKRGLAMVMDLENGDLLALAASPSFNPNNYSKSSWEVIKNWAVTDIYEPGSTMKIFSIAAAIEEGKTSLDEVLVCPGSIKVDTWVVHDHGVSPKEIRRLKPIDIIESSSNVGTSIITRRISKERHREILQSFGFGKVTDSSLNGEVGGIIPELPWRDSMQSAISFGQSIAVTPIQILTAMSAIARDGIRIEPRIIKRIENADGLILKEYKSKETRTLSKETSDKMKYIMKEVVQGKSGTGRDTRIKGYTIAGKTGTADKVENKRYRGNVMSSFIGFYPAENPKILSFVLFDSPQTEHYASLTAVPVFREITSRVLVYLNLPPNNPQELIKNNQDKIK